MCGIAGFFAPGQPQGQDIKDIACDMARRLAHRGPDDAGVWTDLSSGLALSHRRLAILDLSEAGHQPMASTCGRYIIVFNGEIYNHLEMRQKLEQELNPLFRDGWRGHADTETLLAMIATWGLERALKSAVGMFAFALWDREEKTLSLARDRLGEKPLYYGLHNGALLFASELKALHAYPGFSGEVDRKVLALFLRHSVIPAPYSIYRGIFKLPPGTWIKLTNDDVENRRLTVPSSFWSLRDVAEQGKARPFQGRDVEAVAELERLLRQSISGQMLADVPLGAFLSGGIDSSTVVALMQAQSTRPVQTFTIGFHEAGYNEADHGQAVAAHLGTAHTELYVTAEQARAVIPRLSALYDEPFADASQIPTFLVSELARQHVTVSLSGDGGDELFGGYNRYVSAVSIWRKLGWLPHSFRVALAGILSTLPPSVWDRFFGRVSMLLPTAWHHKTLGDKLHKLAEMLAAKSSDEIYERLVSHWEHLSEVVKGVPETPMILPNTDVLTGQMELEHRMMFLDSISYLPDDILVKVDRAAMGVSLETRVPFLDHRLVEFAWQLPLNMKIRHGEGKWLLRQLLDKHVPRALIERPKTGFSVPIGTWLRGPLRDWADSLLDVNRLTKEGYFHAGPIQAKWQEHLSGKRNWSSHLWSILMFQAWLAADKEK